jgi:hypothetical protein
VIQWAMEPVDVNRGRSSNDIRMEKKKRKKRFIVVEKIEEKIELNNNLIENDISMVVLLSFEQNEELIFVHVLPRNKQFEKGNQFDFD